MIQIGQGGYVVGKYTVTIVISFCQVGTLNAKNEIESLPKSMKGGAIYISDFQNSLVGGLNKNICWQYDLMKFTKNILISLNDEN